MSNRYFLSPRIKTLKAIRAKLRPEPVREPLPPPPKAVWRRVTDAIGQLANNTPPGPLH